MLKKELLQLCEELGFNKNALEFKEEKLFKLTDFIISEKNTVEIIKALKLVSQSRFVLIEGQESSGKTTLLNSIAKGFSYNDNEIYNIRLGPHIDYRDLLGYYSNVESCTDFQFLSGILSVCAENGYFVILNGWDQVPVDTAQFLIGLLDNNCIYPQNSTKIKLHDRFRLCATFNTTQKPNNLPFLATHHKWHRITLCDISTSDLNLLLCELFPHLQVLSQKLINLYEKLACEVAVSKADLFRLLRFLKIDSISIYGKIDPSYILTLIDSVLGSNSSPEKRQKLLLIACNCFSVSYQSFVLELEQKKARFVKQTFQNLSKSFAITKSFYGTLYSLHLSLSQNDPVLLIGETGVGKTSLVQKLAQIFEKKLVVINMGSQTDVSSLLGGIKPMPFSIYLDSLINTFSLHFGRINDSDNSQFVDSLRKLSSHRWDKVFRLVLAALDSLIANNYCLEVANMLKSKFKKLQNSLIQKDSIIFNFVDGPLIQAAIEGNWVLVDELNLAPDDVLTALFAVLDNQISCLSQSSVKCLHPDFRVFACINPPTDVGKRRLPTSIFQKFFKIYVNSIDDLDELVSVIIMYLKKFGLSEEFYRKIARFYMDFHKFCLENTFSSFRPILSLRTLCRALLIAQQNLSGNIYKSIKDGIYAAFFSLLDQKSISFWKNYMHSNFPEFFTDKKFEYPQKKGCVLIQGFPLKLGNAPVLIDKSYVLTDYGKKKIKILSRVLSITKAPVLLEGDTAVGKTSLITYMAKITGNICVRINNHKHTDVYDYIGNYTCDTDGRLIFQKGALIQAMQRGYWVILDELNLAPSDVMEMLNRLLDDNRELYIDETQEIIIAHEDFRIFATQNPSNLYSGRNELSRAFRNRFIQIPFNDLNNPDHIIEVLQKRNNLKNNVASYFKSALVKFSFQRKESEIFSEKYGYITIRDVLKWSSRVISAKATSLSQIAKIGFDLLSSRCKNPADVKIIHQTLSEFLPRNVTFSPKTDYYACEILNQTIKFSQLNFPQIIYTKPMLHNLYSALNALSYHEPVLLIGETGSGKTSICEIFAAATNRPFFSYNCHLNMDSSDIVGRLCISCVDGRKTFQWVDGLLPQAMKTGGLFLLDEITLAEDSVIERINSVLENDVRCLVLHEKPLDGEQPEEVKAHPDFIFVATMNPSGDYGKRELSPALRNRFTEIHCLSSHSDDYHAMILHHNLNENLREIKINSKLHELAKIIVQSLNVIGSTLKQDVISTRRVLFIANFINKSAIYSTNIICMVYRAVKTIFLDSFPSETSLNLSQSLKTFLSDLFHVDSLVFDDDYSTKFPLNVSFSKTYDFQADNIKETVMKIKYAMLLDQPIILEGPPGCGKTTIINELAKLNKVSLVRINFSDQTELSDLLGAFVPVSDEGAITFQWQNGPLLDAIVNKKWVLLDEINLACQRVVEGLNSCFDHRSEIYVSELNQTFKIDRSLTRIFATQNPYSSGMGRKGLPKSFLDRFLMVYVSNFSLNTLFSISTTMFPLIAPEQVHYIAEKVCQLAHLYPFMNFNIRDIFRTLETVVLFEKLSVKPAVFILMTLIIKFRYPFDVNSFFNIDKNCFIYNFYRFFRINLSTIQLGPVSLPFPNTFYDFNPETLRLFTTHFEYLSMLSVAVKLNWPSLLCGETSCKTSLVKILSILHNVKLVIISVTSDTDVGDLIGDFNKVDYYSKALKTLAVVLESLNNCNDTIKLQFNTLHDSIKEKNHSKIVENFKFLKFTEILPEKLARLRFYIDKILNSSETTNIEWVLSTFLKAVQKGYWVLFDNINFCTPSIIDRLNCILEPNSSFSLLSSVDIKSHSNFRFFATYNPKFGELSHALRNRCFEIFIPDSAKISVEFNEPIHPPFSIVFSPNLKNDYFLWDLFVIKHFAQNVSDCILHLLFLERSSLEDVNDRVAFLNYSPDIVDQQLIDKIAVTWAEFPNRDEFLPLLNVFDNYPLLLSSKVNQLSYLSESLMFLLRFSLESTRSVELTKFLNDSKNYFIGIVKNNSVFSDDFFNAMFLISKYLIKIYQINKDALVQTILARKLNTISSEFHYDFQTGVCFSSNTNTIVEQIFATESPFFEPVNYSFYQQILTNEEPVFKEQIDHLGLVSSFVVLNDLLNGTLKNPSCYEFFKKRISKIFDKVLCDSTTQRNLISVANFVFYREFIAIFKNENYLSIDSPVSVLLNENSIKCSEVEILSNSRMMSFPYKITCSQMRDLILQFNQSHLSLWLNFMFYLDWQSIFTKQLKIFLYNIIRFIFPIETYSSISQFNNDLSHFMGKIANYDILTAVSTHELGQFFLEFGKYLFSLFATLPDVDPTYENFINDELLSQTRAEISFELKLRTKISEFYQTPQNNPIFNRLPSVYNYISTFLSKKNSLNRPTSLYEDFRQYLTIVNDVIQAEQFDYGSLVEHQNLLLNKYPVFIDFLEPILISIQLMILGLICVNHKKNSDVPAVSTEQSYISDGLMRKIDRLDVCLKNVSLGVLTISEGIQAFCNDFNFLYRSIESILVKCDLVAFYHVSTYKFNDAFLNENLTELLDSQLDSASDLEKIKISLNNVSYSVLSKLDSLLTQNFENARIFQVFESDDKIDCLIRDLIDAHNLQEFTNRKLVDNCNVYEHGSPFYAEKIYQFFGKVKARFLEISDVFEHQLISDVISLIDSLDSISISCPLIVLLEKLDSLYCLILNWNMSVPSKYGIITELETLKNLVITLRKQQLTSWKNILDHYDRRLLINHSLILIKFMASLLNNPTKDSISILIQIIKRQTVGSFLFAIKSLSNIVTLFLSVHPTSSLGVYLNNLVIYFSQFNLNVESFLTEKSKNIRKELNDFATLSTWRDFNYWSVKESSTKAHHTLHKYIKQYQTVMNYPVEFIFKKLNIPNFSPLVLKNSRLIDFNAAECENNPLFSEQVLHTFVSLINRSVHNIDFYYREIKLEDKLQVILSSTKTLAARGSASNSNVKMTELHVLFSNLSKLGLFSQFEFKRSQFDLLDNQEIWCNLDVSKIPQSFCDSFSKCNEYYNNALHRFTLFVDSFAAKSPDVTPQQFKIMQSFSYHLLTVLVSQRSQISKVVELHQFLTNLRQNIDCIKESNFVLVNSIDVFTSCSILSHVSCKILQLKHLIQFRPRGFEYEGPFFPNESLSIEKLNDNVFFDEVFSILELMNKRISFVLNLLKSNTFEPFLQISSLEKIKDSLSFCLSNVAVLKDKLVGFQVLPDCSIFDFLLDDVNQKLSEVQLLWSRQFESPEKTGLNKEIGFFLKSMLKLVETTFQQSDSFSNYTNFHQTPSLIGKVESFLSKNDLVTNSTMFLMQNPSILTLSHFLITHFCGLLESYLGFLLKSIHFSSYLLTYILGIFSDVVKNGLKQDEIVSNLEASHVDDNTVEPGGFGEGKGDENASDAIENQDQIEDAVEQEKMFDSDQASAGEGDLSDETGIEMSEDFRNDDEISGQEDLDNENQVEEDALSTLSNSSFNQLNPEIWGDQDQTHEFTETDLNKAVNEQNNEEKTVANEDNVDIPVNENSDQFKEDINENAPSENERKMDEEIIDKTEENVSNDGDQQTEMDIEKENFEEFGQVNGLENENHDKSENNKVESGGGIGSSTEYQEFLEINHKRPSNSSDFEAKPKMKKFEIVPIEEEVEMADPNDAQCGQDNKYLQSDNLITVQLENSLFSDSKCNDAVKPHNQTPEDVITKNEQKMFEMDVIQPVIVKNDTIVESIPDLDIEAKSGLGLDFNMLFHDVSNLASDLCEKLRIILEPTRRAKYSGDFKTGRKLNIRRIIPYIASNFTRDKIWLRKVKPSDRCYNVIVALDDSSSMRDNNSRLIAIQSMLLLHKTFRLLEIGKVCTLSFGESTEVLFDFDEFFNDHKYHQALSLLNFKQSSTRISKLLDFCRTKFEKVAFGNSESLFENLLIIVSDGRGVYSEGESLVKKTLVALESLNVLVIFVILDSSAENSSSITNLKVPVFSPDSNIPEIKSYLELFPFTYYIILKDIKDLPKMICSISQQWLQVLA